MNTVTVVRRKQLKPAKELSDEEFLRYAQAAATRAANRAERARRAEQTKGEIDRQDRAVRPEATPK